MINYEDEWITEFQFTIDHKDKYKDITYAFSYWCTMPRRFCNPEVQSDFIKWVEETKSHATPL